MTSRPAAPESLIPIHGYLDGKAVVEINAIEQLERMYTIAQTEIKGHMRVEDDLREAAEAELDLRMQVERDLAEAQARIAELEKDAARLSWLEEHHTLHTQVEILYVVDGYQVVLMHEDGFTTLSPAYEGHDLRSAIDEALKSRA